jgi:hypothetical protein
VTAATVRTTAPEASIAWRVVLPDRVVSLKADGAELTATTEDGSITRLSAAGKITAQQVGAADAIPAAPLATPKLVAEFAKQALPGRIVKKIATEGALTAIGYWGGTVQILDGSGAIKSLQMLPNDVSDMLWSGGKLIVGVADGSVVALKVK